MPRKRINKSSFVKAVLADPTRSAATKGCIAYVCSAIVDNEPISTLNMPEFNELDLDYASRYKVEGIDTLDYILYQDFAAGNIIKYLLRLDFAPTIEKYKEDKAKILHYIELYNEVKNG